MQQQPKPWANKLLAVSCFSLAAKMLKAEYSATDVQVNCLSILRFWISFLNWKFEGKCFVRGIDWYSFEQYWYYFWPGSSESWWWRCHLRDTNSSKNGGNYLGGTPMANAFHHPVLFHSLLRELVQAQRPGI